MDQRTTEWFAARLGKVTASRVAEVTARTKNGGYSTSRENYALELALERITGQRVESASSASMAWGVEKEDDARTAYEMQTGCIVMETGLIDHPRLPWAGASPDGLVGHDGLLEIKCPNSATHLKTVASGKADSKYLPQMMWQMACTQRAWVDFVSYDPRFPEESQLFVCRVNRDDKAIAELEAEVSAFLGEVEAIVRKINK